MFPDVSHFFDDSTVITTNQNDAHNYANKKQVAIKWNYRLIKAEPNDKH